LGREGSTLDIKAGELPDDFEKDWVVKNLKSHESYTEKFYNAPEREFPKNITGDILSLLASQVRLDDRQHTNADIETHLKGREWKTKVTIGRFRKSHIDFKKDAVGLEVQLRQHLDLLHDVLKLQGAYRDGKLSRGIMITYDISVGNFKKGGQNANIVELDRMIEEFREVIVFTIPLWAIGLKSR
jgi:hypothetical protein